jgi:hypothetical protein
MKSTLKPYHNKLKALFAQHSQSTVESKQSPDAPITEEPEPIAVGPEPTYTPAYDEKAFTEEVAKQVGWNVGDEVQAKVSNRQMVNKHFVWASVEGWSELVMVRVHDQAAWPAGSTLWCQYVQANSDGNLVFNTKERGPKWKRRAA